MLITIENNPSGEGFLVKDGKEIIAVADHIEHAREAGMKEASWRGWMLVSNVKPTAPKKRVRL